MKRIEGFLLIEVLVAIIVASIVLAILMQGLGSALRDSNIAEHYFKAMILGEAHLALLEKEIGVRIGYEKGRFSEEQDPDGIFSWEQRVTQVTTTSMFETVELPICEVKLTVKWNERHVDLLTYLPKYEESPAER